MTGENLGFDVFIMTPHLFPFFFLSSRDCRSNLDRALGSLREHLLRGRGERGASEETPVLSFIAVWLGLCP